MTVGMDVLGLAALICKLSLSKADGKHSCSLLLFPFVSCVLLYKGLKPKFICWRKPECDYFERKLCIRASFFDTPC